MLKILRKLNIINYSECKIYIKTFKVFYCNLNCKIKRIFF